MRLLIYDNDINNLNKISQMIETFPIETIIDKVSDYNDCILMYKHHVYDKLLIDYTDDIGKKIANKIIDINPKQRLYLLNDEFNCTSGKDCENCKKLYNKETIVKPFNQFQLSKIISKQFKCESYKKNEFEFKLEKVKKSIYNEFPYFKFAFKENKSMLISSPMSISILVHITELLKNNTIDYQVINNEKILLKEYN
jgi:hypothetical protein